MIVRNEAENIVRALDSIDKIRKAGLCNQIIIVDTGSTDNTIQICQNYGAEIYFYNWNGNFSDARNFGLNYIKNNWILSLDADEEINSHIFINNSKLLENMNNHEIGGIRVKIINKLDTQTHSEHIYTRLFRNNSNIRFKNRIHEQISESIENINLKIIDSDFIINHYGYSDITPEKIKRNLKLLELDLLDYPDDDFIKYHLAETLFAAGDLIKSNSIFQNIYNSKNLSETQKEISRIKLAQISLKLDDYKSVEYWTDFISSNSNLEGLKLFIRATSYLMNHRFEEALILYKNPILLNSSLVDNNQRQQAINLINQILSKKS